VAYTTITKTISISSSKEKKNSVFFSPEDSFNLYPIGSIIDISPHGRHTYCGQRDPHWSMISLDLSPEEILENYPRFAEVKYLDCELNAGEMLYIPNGWWHSVTSYGVHVALNIWTESAE